MFTRGTRVTKLSGLLGSVLLLLLLSGCAGESSATSDTATSDTTDATVNGAPADPGTQMATPIGVNFTGIVQADTAVEAETIPDEARFEEIIPLLGRGYAPPDTIGAVGPQHIVEMVNGAYAVYDKTGAELASGGLSAFWRDAGIVDVQQRPAVFDPVVQYDPVGQRFFALAVDNSISTRGENPEANRFLLAVSDSSDPTAGWRGYAVPSNPSNTDPAEQLWADQPMLALNQDGVFITANMFTLGRSDFPPDYETFIAVPKEDLLRGVPNGQLAGTRFDRLDIDVTGYFVQGAIDPYSTGVPGLLLADLANVGSPGQFKISLLTGDVRSPSLDTSIEPIEVSPYEPAPTARQPNGAEEVDTGDGQFVPNYNLSVRDGSLWGVETVESNDRAALRWFEIDTRTRTLRQEGLIADPSLDFYYGSITANEFGDVVLGFNGSGTGQFISSYAAIGQTDDSTTTFGSPILLKEGVSTYEFKLVPDSRRLRWGDYSSTVVDPQDPLSFWTFQEFVSDQDTWGTQISQIRLTE